MKPLTSEEVLNRDREERRGQEPTLIYHEHQGKETRFVYPDRVRVVWREEMRWHERWEERR